MGDALPVLWVVAYCIYAVALVLMMAWWFLQDGSDD